MAFPEEGERFFWGFFCGLYYVTWYVCWGHVNRFDLDSQRRGNDFLVVFYHVTWYVGAVLILIPKRSGMLGPLILISRGGGVHVTRYVGPC